jgi:hypothetical protein
MKQLLLGMMEQLGPPFSNMDLIRPFCNGSFARYSFQVVNCNEFLRQTTDEK